MGQWLSKSPDSSAATNRAGGEAAGISIRGLTDPLTTLNGRNIFGFNLTNGTTGITPIDGPGFGNWAQANLGLPANYLTANNLNAVYLWTALALVMITVFCSARLRDSRLGRAWVAIREDEIAASAAWAASRS